MQIQKIHDKNLNCRATIRARTVFAALSLLIVLLFSISPAVAVRRPILDYTGDNRTDFITLSAASATAPLTWKVLRNPANPAPNQAFIRIFDYGLGSDSITPGDFAGDGKWEVGVSRVIGGQYNQFYSPFPEGSGPISSTTVRQWGASGDALSRDGDYDGDGKDDFTVIRTVSSQYIWYILGSGGTSRAVQYGRVAAGTSIFRFRGADFTGDNRDELVIASVNTTTFDVTWIIGDSITGVPVLTIQWGNFNTDFIVQPDDYTGDGRADIVVARVGAANPNGIPWYIRNTATGNQVTPVKQFGIADPDFTANDLPIRGDYDGDNIADIAVFRPSTREFFWVPSSSPNTTGGQQWGAAGDTALASFFVF